MRTFEELEQALLKAEAQNKKLRTVCNAIANAHIHNANGYVLINNRSLENLEKALASTGIETFKAELDEVESVLEITSWTEWSAYSTSIWNEECPKCNGKRCTGHTKTCELSALKTELEAKRDALLRAIKEMG